jgi:RND family efflux transporter MFP subunit
MCISERVHWSPRDSTNASIEYFRRYLLHPTFADRATLTSVVGFLNELGLRFDYLLSPPERLLPSGTTQMALDQNTLNSLRIDRTPVPSGDSSPRRKYLVVALIFAAALGAGAWLLMGNQAVEVQLAEATATRSGGPATVLDASGYVVARRQATVSAKVTGKVEEVLIEEGMRVKEGQVLAKLDTSTTSRQLDLAQQQLLATRSELAQVKVRLGEAQRAAKRAEQLRADKLIAEADLDTAQSTAAAVQAQLDALRSQVNVAEASVRVQQQNMSDLIVRAPFDGVVISKDAQPGEMVSPISAGGGFTRTGIATIVDMDSREIEVDVNEAFIHRVSDDQQTEAILDAYPDWTIPSHVISIVPTADRQKATVRVRIGFDQLDPRILPDMGVKVRFLDKANEAGNAPTRAAVEVPGSAVFSADGKSYVWRVSDNKAERVAVSTGNSRNDRIEVLSGINAGDSVVLQPNDKLQDGGKVKVKSQ